MLQTLTDKCMSYDKNPWKTVEYKSSGRSSLANIASTGDTILTNPYKDLPNKPYKYQVYVGKTVIFHL